MAKIQRLKKFVEENGSIVKMPTMRAWIKKSAKNGASTWIVRIGALIYVDVEKFFKWAKKQSKK